VRESITLSLLPTHVQTLRGEPDEHAGQLARVENWRRVARQFNERSAPPSVLALAEAAGGVTLTATVEASIATGRPGEAADARVRHGLGRVPESVVVMVRVPNSPAGAALIWDPAGLAGATGGNETAWDNEYLFLRSNVPAPGGEFQFIVT
jgi:hypothetical protein